MLSATALVVLHVMVWDCNGGRLLTEFTREMPDYATAIETCRKTGVETARRLTQKWKAKGYPHAFTNVDCHWGLGAPSEPA
jgi:hypothetical protein